MITRRSLIGGILAGFAGPAIVKAEILMPGREMPGFVHPNWYRS